MSRGVNFCMLRGNETQLGTRFFVYLWTVSGVNRVQFVSDMMSRIIN